MTIPSNKTALSAAEALVLQDPNRNQGRAAFKLTLMELLARKVITLRHEEERSRFGRVRKTDYLHLSQDAQSQAAQNTQFGAVLGILEQAGAQGSGATIDRVIQQARKLFGTDLAKFQPTQIIPALISRGLVEQYTTKRLGIFTTTRYRPTAAGEALQQEINGHLSQARALPTLAEQDPASAVALVATLGSMVLLVDELKPHYGRISQALRVNHGDTGDFDTSAIDSSDASGFAAFDSIGDSFDFDLAAFDTLDSSLDAFDSGFDAADSGSDSGDSGDSGGSSD